MIEAIPSRKVKHKYDILPPHIQIKINNRNQFLRKLRYTRNATARSHNRAIANILSSSRYRQFNQRIQEKNRRIQFNN
jgi:hypothetical protein